MKNLKGKYAVLTGASGGLGQYMAHALSAEGIHLYMVAFPGQELEELKSALKPYGTEVKVAPMDLRQAANVEALVDQARGAFGRIDILINNAGIEYTAPYHLLDWDSIADVVGLNLLAAMHLTRLVIPEMVARRSGQIINISSLAGKAGPALQESYAASKAGLIAFTSSLRATYMGQGIEASVITPGFVEAGIYARIKRDSGVSAPPLLGSSRPEKVARALIRAMQLNLPDVVINPFPVRPLFALTAIWPRLGEKLVRMTGAHQFFRNVWQAQAGKDAEKDAA